jgi:hypothetical protein
MNEERMIVKQYLENVNAGLAVLEAFNEKSLRVLAEFLEAVLKSFPEAKFEYGDDGFFLYRERPETADECAVRMARIAREEKYHLR